MQNLDKAAFSLDQKSHYAKTWCMYLNIERVCFDVMRCVKYLQFRWKSRRQHTFLLSSEKLDDFFFKEIFEYQFLTHTLLLKR